MHGQTYVCGNIADSAVPLEQVAESLAEAVNECESTVAALVEEFEALAERVSKLLQFAGMTTQSIEAASVLEIPGKVQRLTARIRQLVRDRFDADAAVSDAVSDEQKLVNRLLSLSTGNQSISREIRTLSVLTTIEVARLEESGSGFQYLARELRAASETMSAGAREFTGRVRLRRRAIEQTRRRVSAMLPETERQFSQIEGQLEDVLNRVNISVEELSACPSQLTDCGESVAGRIAGVVSAIQVHDITRQQSQHVCNALLEMAAKTRQHSESPACEMAMGLRIQVYQLKNVKAVMEAWSSRIDECLESILSVSQSRLEQVAALVLVQEQQLFVGLRRIEAIEQQCEQDRAEVDEALSGLASLLALADEHVRIAQTTRDRLQLLSFNSIVGARKLGSRANVMLEISRQITRTASGWRAVAEDAERTSAELQRRMDRSHNAIASLMDKREDALRGALSEASGPLAALKTAAECATENAARMAELTAGLHERVTIARSISRSLRNISSEIGGSADRLEAMRGELAGEDGDGERNLQALEAEYSGAYTTEAERNILRAALYGEALPAAELAVTGNDVELF